MNPALRLVSNVRRGMLLGGIAAAMVAFSPTAYAQNASGEVVVLNWFGGSEAETWARLEAAFTEANPGVTVRNIQVATQGDARGGIRTALLGGEVADVIISAWPAFRKELVDGGILRPIDQQWESFNWDERLAASWRDLSSNDGVTYGVTYTYGDRSGMFYKPAHLEKAGLSAPPATWDEFIHSFAALKAAGFATPVAMPAKSWAHGEWFETLLMRTAGVDVVDKLARHEIPWTDASAKGALLKLKEMLDAGCCADAATMFASHWDTEADQLFKADARNYELIGMFVNGRATKDYGLVEGKDYSYFQFPALGLGHDDESLVDSKEVLVTTNGANPAAADLFLDFLTTKTAADILQGAGLASPSNLADTSQLGPVQQIATAAVAKSKVHFVLGDLLPGDLVNEYRVQLQKFLQDPSEANIDVVLAAIEAKAAISY